MDIRSALEAIDDNGDGCDALDDIMQTAWFVIVTKLKETVGQDLTGPFLGYDAAMDHFITMGPASDYEHKYIEQIFSPAERLRISVGDRENRKERDNG